MPWTELDLDSGWWHAAGRFALKAGKRTGYHLVLPHSVCFRALQVESRFRRSYSQPRSRQTVVNPQKWNERLRKNTRGSMTSACTIFGNGRQRARLTRKSAFPGSQSRRY